MSERVREDIQSVLYRDPVAHNVLKVFTYYPGLHTVWLHRLAHGSWTSSWKWLARLVSNFGHWMIGIEIHPGARISRRFSIDHGMGIVIGEIAEIGDDVTLYQGVALGGIIQSKDERHPTLGNNVAAGAGAKVLGPFTVGKGAKVGSDAVVIKEVPPGTTVIGTLGRIIIREDTEQQIKRRAMAEKLSSDTHEVGRDMPDPVTRAISQLLDHLQAVDGWLKNMCQALTALGNDCCAKDLPALREEDFAGIKDKDGSPAT